MSSVRFSESETPPGEVLRRLLLCLICLGAVAIAVVFSPAAGIVDLRVQQESGNSNLR